MSDLEHRFGGVIRLYSREGFDRLQASHVCVIGIGGVGSWTVEALARSGVGELTLIDLDDICVSNVNRQIHALDGNIGKQKVDAIAERCRLINPQVKVNTKSCFFSERNVEELLGIQFSAVVDAIDSLKEKCLLLASCKRKKIPIVTVGGAGGKRFPEEVMIEDLSKTYGDALLGKVRKKLRQDYGFSRNLKRKFSIDAVFSPEQPLFPDAHGGICETITTDTSLKLDCQNGYGAISPVTGAFGLFAASCVLKKIAGGPAKKLLQ